jgi:hypothetical protein
MLYWYLVLNIWYQSSRSWGFTATSETPWNFCYNVFSTMFQKKRLGGYLVDGSRYVGFKIFSRGLILSEIQPVQDRVLESS